MFIIRDRVVNLLALAIEELGRDPIPGVVYGPLAASNGAVWRELKPPPIRLDERGLVHACWRGPAD